MNDRHRFGALVAALRSCGFMGIFLLMPIGVVGVVGGDVVWGLAILALTLTSVRAFWLSVQIDQETLKVTNFFGSTVMPLDAANPIQVTLPRKKLSFAPRMKFEGQSTVVYATALSDLTRLMGLEWVYRSRVKAFLETVKDHPHLRIVPLQDGDLIHSYFVDDLRADIHRSSEQF